MLFPVNNCSVAERSGISVSFILCSDFLSLDSLFCSIHRKKFDQYSVSTKYQLTTTFSSEEMNRTILKYKQLLLLVKFWLEFHNCLEDSGEDPYETHVVLALGNFVKNLEEKHKRRRKYLLSTKCKKFRISYKNITIKQSEYKKSRDLPATNEESKRTHVRFNNSDEEENTRVRFNSDNDEEVNTNVRFYSETELKVESIPEQELQRTRSPKEYFYDQRELRRRQYAVQEEIRRRKVLEEYLKETRRRDRSLCESFVLLVLQILTFVVCFIVLCAMTASLEFNLFWAVIITFATWRQQ